MPRINIKPVFWDAANGTLVRLNNNGIYVVVENGVGSDSATEGFLLVGTTYTILTYQSGDDFANVADVQEGDVNTDGCIFIATGTTPTDWSNGSVLEVEQN